MERWNFLGIFIFAYGIPASTGETENSTLTSCGGYLEGPSVISMYNIGANASCIWTVTTTYHSAYIGLSLANLLPGYDKLAIYGVANGVPSSPTFISGRGSIYPVPGNVFLVILHASDFGFSDRSFILNIYCSGSSKPLTGFEILSSQSRNVSYPSGGGTYKYKENAMFVLAPTRVRSANVTFTRFELGQDQDYLRIYSLKNNVFRNVANLTGSSIPSPVNLGGWDKGLIIFTSNTGGRYRGFAFNWTTEGHAHEESGGAVVTNMGCVSMLVIICALVYLV